VEDGSDTCAAATAAKTDVATHPPTNAARVMSI